MSTIAVNEITKADGSGSLSVPAESGTVVTTASPSLGRRNLIINGAMQVAQRGTSFSSSAVGGGRYTVDRWSVPNRTRAVQSSDAPTGFKYSLFIDREQSAGIEPFTISTGLETQDIVQTGTYTLSFYAKSPTVTTVNVNVQDRTNVSEGGTNNESFLTDEAVTITSSWARYSVNFTLSDVVFTGTSLRLSIGNTTAALTSELYITGVQLEVGSVASSYEHRSYGEELALCQRYYWRLAADDSPDVQSYWAMAVGDGTNMYTPIIFPTQMRSTPSLDASNNTSDYRTIGNQANTFDTFALSNASPKTALLSTVLAVAAGQSVVVRGRQAGAYIAFEAEL